MPEITPSFVMGYEREMRVIQESSYVNRLAAENTWWNKVARRMPIERLTERVTWFLETAMIEPTGPTNTGVLDYENLVTQTAEYPTFRHGKGIRVDRDQLEDLDGTGLNALSAWAAQIGSDIAYYPQRLMAQLLLNGANTDGSANAYDGIPFFADNTSNTVGGVSVHGHPYNPFRPEVGGYQTWLKGAASGAYPGALPLDVSVSADTALVNLGKAIAYIQSVKQANGIDPRGLTPAYILAPAQMAPRLRQLTDAKFIAQVASSGAGSGDVQAVIAGFNLGIPVIAQEIGASFSYNAKMPFMASGGKVTFKSESLSGSDTTYYIVCREAANTQLGSLLYVSRKDFKVNYYTGDSGGTAMSAELDRMNKFEYHCQGRMSAQYGHPYGIFRFDST